MKKSLVFLLIGCLSYFTVSCVPSDDIVVDENLLEVLEKTGVNYQIDQLDATLKMLPMMSSALSLATDEETGIMDVLKVMLSSSETRKNVLQYFQENVDKDSLAKINEIYDTPLLQEMAKVESGQTNQMTTAEQMALIEKGIEAGKSGNLDAIAESFKVEASEERIALVKELIQVLGTQDRMFEFIQYEKTSVTQHISDKYADNEVLQEELEKVGFEGDVSGNYMQQIKEASLSSTLYLYRDVSDQKLTEYIDWMKSPVMQYYRKHKEEAFMYATTLAKEKMMEQLEGAMKEEKKEVSNATEE